ncbi:MAG: HIT family protein [Candidatus Hermodarchaeota archaeon]
MRLTQVSSATANPLSRTSVSAADMSDDCIFCKIVKGEIPSSVIFEDEISVAFMDIFPVTKGHCLLIPKEHHVNIFDIDLELLAQLSKRLAELTRRVNNALGPEGVLNAVANGPGAGQEVFHLHFHVIPRNSGDPFGFKFPPNYRDEMAPRDELDKIASLISEASPTA